VCCVAKKQHGEICGEYFALKKAFLIKTLLVQAKRSMPLVFKKKPIFLLKFAKIAENSCHYIYPRFQN
jgi:L-cystine uptake protein TcyP (sodium:dicarboxylate symporter family)